MGKPHGADLRLAREKTSTIDPERGDDFFADLRSSFLQATQAERCVIKLAPGSGSARAGRRSPFRAIRRPFPFHGSKCSRRDSGARSRST